jgi:hypothetical protein
LDATFRSPFLTKGVMRASFQSDGTVPESGIAEKLKSGKDQIDFILLDFAKAFDKVPHKRLLHKLCHYAFRSPFLNKGVMRAFFQSDGTVPESSDVWKTLTMARANPEAHSLVRI